ncbi:myrosinase 1-like [Anticarsia gemmatalis]|uniref:myrosinase 1-like n=1 Tax=Anticarsia gemmatalis TaxID=129554 RepID=UPI003F777A17
MVYFHSALLGVSWCAEDLTFPPGFKFGAASASYQVEGAWNVSDKGENIWDRFTHEHPEVIYGGHTGDVACDSYHLWKRDIEMAKELGLHFYRFSLSWTRILPTGFANYVSDDGVKYYNNLINGLLAEGIEPMITIYHWDLPQSIQDLGKMQMITLLLLAGRYSHPIFSKEGGWPPAIEKLFEENSKKKGYSRTTFPAFTQEEKELVRGTYDFYAMNHYTSRVVRPAKKGEQLRPWPLGDAVDLNAVLGKRPEWESVSSSWFFVNPPGIRKMLVWLKQKYGDIKFMITENGLSTDGGLDDQDRIQYYKDYLKQVLLAIKEDGVKVTHYTAWTMLDNFEWMDGYNVKFGLYEVDFNDPERTRTPRSSAHFYARIIKSHSLNVPTAHADELWRLQLFIAMWCRIVVLSALLGVSWCVEDWTFPPGFKFGAASASYQVEGAWNVSDKSENIWDRFTHEHPEIIYGGHTGDVACDSYHLWKRDIEIAKELGIHFYRFSLSWSRLLPTGFANYLSEDGVKYYDNLINGLLAEGIAPMVTIYHWDLPQSLQDLGGWTNPLIADWFADYARVVYSLFGDRVKIWLTINEPIVVCDVAYNSGVMAPGHLSPEVGAYLCNKNILLAHAKAYRIYDEEFKPKYHGEVSLANQLLWIEGLTENEEELAELARENCAGRYSHPIYSKEGGWPPAIEKLFEENSKKKGYSRSTFPAFTQEEIELIRGTYDFYAMNHYTSRVIRPAKEGEQLTPWPLGDAVDLNAVLGKRPDWESVSSSWFFVNPPGIRKKLVWLKQKYGDMKFMITENGLSTNGGRDDQDRVQYYADYLKQVLLAIKEDGVNVTHYTAWTLLDNFEWMDGYNVKFGLYEVDFNDPERTRTARSSARFYASIIKSHSLNVPIAHEDEL